MPETDIADKLASIDAQLQARTATERFAAIISVCLLGLGLWQTFGPKRDALVLIERGPNS